MNSGSILIKIFYFLFNYWYFIYYIYIMYSNVLFEVVFEMGSDYWLLKNSVII